MTKPEYKPRSQVRQDRHLLHRSVAPREWLMKALQSHAQRAAELVDELDRSLELERAIPGIFSSGDVRILIKPGPVPEDRKPPYPARYFVVEILRATLKDGETPSSNPEILHRCTLADLPADLIEAWHKCPH